MHFGLHLPTRTKYLLLEMSQRPALSAYFAPQVDEETRQSGYRYYQNAAVQLHRNTSARLLATVSGTGRFRVTVVRHGESVLVACSCRYYQRRQVLCKHIWATVLASEDKTHPVEDETPSLLPEDPARYLGWLDHSYRDNHQAASISENDNPSRSAQVHLPSRSLKLAEIRDGRHDLRNPNVRHSAGKQVLCYVIDVRASQAAEQPVIEIYQREPLPHVEHEGSSRRPSTNWQGMIHVPFTGDLTDLTDVCGPQDYEILAALRDMPRQRISEHVLASLLRVRPLVSLWRLYLLPLDMQSSLLAKMCATGRCFLKPPEGHEVDPVPLEWDNGPPWELCLRVSEMTQGGDCGISGMLRRKSAALRWESIDLCGADLIVAGGLLFNDHRIATVCDSGSSVWMIFLHKRGSIPAPRDQLSFTLKRMLFVKRLPAVEFAEETGYRILTERPQPRIAIRKSDGVRHMPRRGLVCELAFDYGGHTIRVDDPASGRLVDEARLVVIRDSAEEQRAREHLISCGLQFGEDQNCGEPVFRLKAALLAYTVRRLLTDGWYVEAEGRLYRNPHNFNLSVSSGNDWFEIQGGVTYGQKQIPLPTLLKAARRGRRMVRLGDGTYGLLPERWLKTLDLIAGLGKFDGDSVRFGFAQAVLLELLLEERPEVGFDEGFSKLKAKLDTFSQVIPLDPPESFQGTLRGYQCEALGWFAFLDQFGFGGCLADDMGLGKTVQVLALLDSRRAARRTASAAASAAAAAATTGKAVVRAPSLIVVPRSLVFNWKQEAARFTPRLRVLDHATLDRTSDLNAFLDYDVVLTTYGILRNDIVRLKEFSFDYIVLDEAQAVKNPQTASSKATRLVQGQRRLALSGTPIENHLGELWSLFEFLNPGFLGGLSVFRKAIGNKETPDERLSTILARALRPFILRRTKEQVAPELPKKVEQTLFCELRGSERTMYNELRDYYRASLNGKIENVGMNRMAFVILEALLRLRQAACHPALVDKADTSRPSAKVEMLLEQLDDVLAEERKALVFSQFTSLLSIVRSRLDDKNVVYEYLDGSIRNRQERVDRFQNDPDCRLFLISLKAGGLGLNLTAAEYVFLMDPWWNPAVEIQAIDRTHRIGQYKRVFAYRLIAKDTVEEKVLELQKSKRHLAETIITADNRLMSDLSREDLEFLLS